MNKKTESKPFERAIMISEYWLFIQVYSKAWEKVAHISVNFSSIYRFCKNYQLSSFFLQQELIFTSRKLLLEFLHKLR